MIENEVSRIQSLWDSTKQLSQDIGVREGTVAMWRQRGCFPLDMVPTVIDAAIKRGFASQIPPRSYRRRNQAACYELMAYKYLHQLRDEAVNGVAA